MRAGATRAALAHQRAGSMTKSAGAGLFMARQHDCQTGNSSRFANSKFNYQQLLSHRNHSVFW